jgi:hypothetical protein
MKFYIAGCPCNWQCDNNKMCNNEQQWNIYMQVYTCLFKLTFQEIKEGYQSYIISEYKLLLHAGFDWQGYLILIQKFTVFVSLSFPSFPFFLFVCLSLLSTLVLLLILHFIMIMVRDEDDYILNCMSALMYHLAPTQITLKIFLKSGHDPDLSLYE